MVLDSRQEQPVAAFAELFNSGALPPLMQVTHAESSAGLGRRMGQLSTGPVKAEQLGCPANLAAWHNSCVIMMLDVLSWS